MINQLTCRSSNLSSLGYKPGCWLDMNIIFIHLLELYILLNLGYNFIDSRNYVCEKLNLFSLVLYISNCNTVTFTWIMFMLQTTKRIFMEMISWHFCWSQSWWGIISILMEIILQCGILTYCDHATKNILSLLTSFVADRIKILHG